ncbi:MAG: EAL domain-containing protein [Oxalobacter sp.]|nr:MAG: EAL domain-containing protein [Oxalobacter sp.]
MAHSDSFSLSINAITKWCAGMVCLFMASALSHSALAQTGIDPEFSSDLRPERPAVIKVVMDDNYPPYIFRNKEGVLQGILKDKWELWSKKTGVPVHIHAMDWHLAQQTMYTGQADVMDTAFKTPEREKLLEFSKPYAPLETVVFFHNTISGIHGLNDLRGFAIGVKDGGATTAWLKSQGITNLRQYPSYESIIDAAARDEIRVFCMEKPPALYFLFKKNLEGEYRHTATLYSGQFHWGTRKGDKALRLYIEQGFEKISKGEQNAIDERWKGVPLSARPEMRYAKYMLYSLFAVLCVAGTLGLVSWTLRRKVQSKTAELSATLEALRTSERYNRMLFESTTVGLMLCTLDDNIIDANQAFADILGYTTQEVTRLSTKAIAVQESEVQELAQREKLLETGEMDPCEKEFIRKTGERITVRIIGSLIERSGERYILSSVEDVTSRKEAEARIQFLAYHDPLTGLPNRLYAQERFAQAVDYSEDEASKVALLLLDLDNFKSINDSLGHAAGDGLLKATAKRLKGALAREVTISRQGGDEFLIVIPGLKNAETVDKILSQVMLAMQEPFEIEGNELTTSVSAGVAMYPEDGRDFDRLMRNADIAMYQAKAMGRNGFCFFDEDMHTKAYEWLNLGSRLRRAVERNELVLHYQPLVDLHTGDVLGAEALLRWNHPELGMLDPGRFIPLAEDTGLIVPIGEWVLHEACQQGAVWQKNGYPDFQIAVNLSAVQFRRHELEKSVKSAIDLSGIDPARVELELTETILLTNAESTLETVRRLKQLGVSLSIDDFGTGYSSLSYLKRFAVNKLKIDRSFTRNLISNFDDAAIVRAIIQMAKSLGLKTIAEGVENEMAVAWLREHECDEGQGYHFARPMSADNFAVYLAEKTPPKNSGSEA